MEGLENLNVMVKMCLLEINYLKENFYVFEEITGFTMEKITRNWKGANNDSATLVEYDNLCTSLSTVTNLARKLNLHFHLRSEGNGTYSYIPELNEYVSINPEKPQREIEEQSNQIEVNSLSTSLTNKNYENVSIPPIEMNDEQNNDSVAQFYKQLSIKEFKPNCQITASITHIQNLHKLQFFICELNTIDANKIQQLGMMRHLRQNSEIPFENEMFGVVQDGVIWRAIRSNNSTITSGAEFEAMLLDLGESVRINKDNLIYFLPPEFKEIPAQAVPCVLLDVATASEIELQEQLLKWRYQKVTLEVEKNDDNFLYVRFMSDNDDALKFLETNPFKKDILQTLDIKIINDSNQENSCKSLTEEDLDMLYEEPLSTTNAMKAVMGYDPRDEKRICRFYNAKTKSCFKGASCRQEHSLMLRDGWTKDVLPANNIVNTILPTVHYDVDTVVSITPTHIGQLRQFYCQITDQNVNNDPLIWTSEDISDLWNLESAPMIFDIVLAKYKDGMWYRARVMEADDAGKQFKVFYIDYGNHETVDIKSLRKCDYAIAQWPDQAVLCRIADFEYTPRSNKKRKQAVDLLCKTLLNQQLNVKVVHHSEELIIKIIDKKFSSLVNEINKIIL